MLVGNTNIEIFCWIFVGFLVGMPVTVLVHDEVGDFIDDTFGFSVGFLSVFQLVFLKENIDGYSV